MEPKSLYKKKQRSWSSQKKTGAGAGDPGKKRSRSRLKKIRNRRRSRLKKNKYKISHPPSRHSFGPEFRHVSPPPHFRPLVKTAGFICETHSVKKCLKKKSLQNGEHYTSYTKKILTRGNVWEFVKNSVSLLMFWFYLQYCHKNLMYNWNIVLLKYEFCTL